jgi:hypothetical protein
MLIVYDFMHFRQGNCVNLAKTIQKTNLFCSFLWGNLGSYFHSLYKSARLDHTLGIYSGLYTAHDGFVYA